MTLWSVYHTLFGVFATFTVSYITPMVWYPHFIFYSAGQVNYHTWPGETWLATDPLAWHQLYGYL